MAEEIKYELVKTIGALGEGSKGWKKEVNIIKWNDRPGKIDILSVSYIYYHNFDLFVPYFIYYPVITLPDAVIVVLKPF